MRCVLHRLGGRTGLIDRWRRRVGVETPLLGLGTRPRVARIVFGDRRTHRPLELANATFDGNLARVVIDGRTEVEIRERLQPWLKS